MRTPRHCGLALAALLAGGFDVPKALHAGRIARQRARRPGASNGSIASKIRGTISPATPSSNSPKPI
jgi:hypothetical protein